MDNMFILAHALQQQDPSLPIPERLGRALAGAGPSITLAASCEALAFGLGGLTTMPAVRNFSLCAAVAVLLDYALQVSLHALLTQTGAVSWVAVYPRSICSVLTNDQSSKLCISKSSVTAHMEKLRSSCKSPFAKGISSLKADYRGCSVDVPDGVMPVCPCELESWLLLSA